MLGYLRWLDWEIWRWDHPRTGCSLAWLGDNTGNTATGWSRALSAFSFRRAGLGLPGAWPARTRLAGPGNDGVAQLQPALVWRLALDWDLRGQNASVLQAARLFTSAQPPALAVQ